MAAAFIRILIVLLTTPPVFAYEYTVKHKDTLWSIAKRELGDPGRWVEIMELNGIAAPSDLEEGSLIEIPERSDGSAARESDPGPDRPAREAGASVDRPIASAGGVRGEVIALLKAAEFAPPEKTDRIGEDSLHERQPVEPASGEPPIEMIRESAPLAPSWRETLLPRSSAASDAPAIPNPLTLSEAIAIGLGRAPEIKSAMENVTATRADRGVARADGIPSVTVSGDARRSETFKSTSTFFGTDEATFAGTLTINQSLYSFGRISSALKAATAEEAAALADLANAEAAIRFGVEEAYLDALLAREREIVAVDALAVAEELLRIATVRLAAGAGTKYEVMKARAESASSGAALAQAKYVTRSAAEKLAAAMGLPSSTSIYIVNDDDGELLRPIAPELAVSIAMSELPTLAALAHRIDASRSRIENARAQGRPSIDAFASGTYTRHEYITRSTFTGSNKNESTGFLGVGVSIPIFDGYRSRENAEGVAARTTSLEAQYERAKIEAERAVRAVYFDLAASYEALLAEDKGVAAATEALRLAQLSYREGILASLDVIQASHALTAARNARGEQVFAYRLGIARLARASGSLSVVEKPEEK